MAKAAWLKKETKLWVERGIINGDQAQQIIGLYPEDHKNRLITVLLILGAILLGAGIILFLASNWQYLPKWFKVTLVLSQLVLFHLSSQYMHASYPRLSAALSLLGCIMFGAGIWLIAQIFNINSHFPNGLLFWFLGVLPVAYFLREPLPLSLSAILLGGWVVAEHSTSPFTIMLALLFFAAVFHLAYSMRSPFALAVSLLSAVTFIITEFITFMDKVNRPQDMYSYFDGSFLIPLALLLTAMIISCLAGHPANDSNRFSLIYSVIGLVLTGVSLYAISFEYFARGVAGLHSSVLNINALWLLYVLSAATLAYFIFREKDGYAASLKKYSFWVILDVIILAILVFPIGKTLLMIALNLLMFAWALWLILSGYQNQNSFYFTLGIVAFIIFTVTEYFNLFWEMMPKSLFFIAGGLVLLLGGYLLERQRRKVISSWQEEAAHEAKS